MEESVVNLLFLITCSLVLTNCMTHQTKADLLQQKIGYPFSETPLISNRDEYAQPVIVAIHNDSEYVIELPNDGSDYTVSIPLNELKPQVKTKKETC